MLTIQNVSKRFGTHQANNNINLTINDGRIFGLLGPNGAGKTTLIRMITNIILPDSGTITLGADAPAAISQNVIGYLPEERGLYKKLTVAEQIVYFAELKGLTSREAIQRATWWLNRMDASGWERRKVQELSKGMQQKVQFIATVVHNPKILILDEPFSGLDPVNAGILIDVIKELQSNGTTIILSTHQMDQVERLCDDIALIDRGTVVLEGPVREVRSRFRSDRIHVEYSGLSIPRTVPGTEVVDSSAGRLELRIINPSLTGNQVLKHLMDETEITAFSIAEPSLHDIFVQTVTRAHHQVVEPTTTSD